MRTIGEILTAAPPDAIALLSAGRAPLTYGCLCEQVANLSAAVRAAGIRREDRVAVIVPNGPEMALSFLGVASVAVCAPLNPNYTASEFESYLTDLNIRAAIVSPGQANAMAALERLAIPSIDVSKFDARADIDPAQLDDVALVLQTSGTTSRPKTVPLTHRNLCVSAGNVAATLQLTSADRCLNVMPLFHIHGLVAALLAPLASGGSVVCTPGFSAAEFFSWLDEFQPTWYTAVPTMHQAILARSEMKRDVIARRPLRFIRSSSASLAPAAMEHLEEVFRAPVIEAYGMTEAAHQMASNLPARRKPGTVGFPAGPSITVMNEQGQTLPAGVTGEIVIRGENVMLGYSNAPAANEAAFQYGWFHTGDLGFFDADGCLVISGRIKEIINRGGEKISPREVDEVLLEHPTIAEAVTFSIPHRQLGEAVGAAVVAKGNAALSEIELREFAATRLAHFKVPAIVKIVAEIPKAATGKIQRVGLAARLGIGEIDERQTQAGYAAPRTSLEATLQKTLSEVLRVSPIGIHDNFFACGGDSLAATILITRIARETGIEPSFVRFLDNPTIAALAEDIATRGVAKRISGLVPIQPHGSKPALFCVPGHDGIPLAFCNFAPHLGSEQPLFAFPPRLLAPGETSYPLEDLAARYIELMKRHQPVGPYHVAGYCFGGFVAFETARQLAARGEQVALLALIDTPSPKAGRSPFSSVLAQKLRHFRRRVKLQRDTLAGKNLAEAMRHLAGRVGAFLRQTRFRTGYCAYRVLADLHSPIPSSLRDVRFANSLSLRRYRPQPYSGSAILLRVQDRRPAVEQMGWGGLILGGLEILDSPYHYLGPQAEPVVRVMAEQLRARLG